jgi:hypothetical protein
MEYYAFIGYLIVGLGVIVSLFLAVGLPLIKIATRLQKIEDRLDHIDTTLGGHSTKIEDHEKRITQSEGEIKVLKMKNSHRGH